VQSGQASFELHLHHQAVTPPGRELWVIPQPAKIGAQPMRQEDVAYERGPPVQFEENRLFAVRLTVVIKAPPGQDIKSSSSIPPNYRLFAFHSILPLQVVEIRHQPLPKQLGDRNNTSCLSLIQISIVALREHK